MKKRKRMMAVLLAAVMSMTVAVPAHADTNTVTFNSYDDYLNFLKENGYDTTTVTDGTTTEENWSDDDTSSDPSGNVMYRMYNPNSGEHFYTAKKGERNNLIMSGWSYERTGWVAPKTGRAVYRVYNPNTGDHHYTTSVGEKNKLVAAGWNDEGIGWYSVKDIDGAVPVYRQYNPNAKSGAHNYTTNASEAQNLIKAGWKDEGIGWYALAKGTGSGSAGLRITSGDIAYDEDPYVNYMVEDMIREAGVTASMSDDQKISAIYHYMVHHFTHQHSYQGSKAYYDLKKIRNNADTMHILTEMMVKSGKAKYANIGYADEFIYRGGVCDDNTAAFVAMCRHVGVRAGFCGGYYLNRSGTKSGHAWPYAYVGSTQYFYDIDVEIQNLGKGQGDWYWYKKTRAEANLTHEFGYIDDVDA